MESTLHFINTLTRHWTEKGLCVVTVCHVSVNAMVTLTNDDRTRPNKTYSVLTEMLFGLCIVECFTMV